MVETIVRGPIESKCMESGKILIGEALTGLSDEVLFGYGSQVSEALSMHRDTMLQYTSAQLVDIIREGRAVVVAGDAGACYAFAQLSPWINNRNGHEFVAAVEFRSWKSWRKNNGVFALRGGIELSRQIYPGVPVYAVAEVGNEKAQKIFESEGAVLLPGMPDSMQVELGDGQANVKVFALTSGSKR